MKTKFRPLHDRVVIKRTEQDAKTAGGIIIPDTVKEKPIQGVVMAVGKGAIADNGELRPTEVQEGDKVLFGKYSGTEIKLDSEELLIMRESDILGILQ